ncbi:MAG: cell division protein FtsW [Paracoccaceae bacterium]|jgi:cell division protein FtsW
MTALLARQPADVSAIDRSFLVLVLALLLIGFVAMTSASVEFADRRYGDAFFFAKRYGVYLLLASVLALMTYQVPMNFWRKNSWLLLLLGFVLLALVLIPGIGREVNGSRRWLALGPFTLQASELVKLFVVLYLAGYLVRRNEEVKNKFAGFVKPMAVVSAVTLLLMMEPDFGATVVTVGTALALLFLAGVRLVQFLAVIAACVAVLVATVLISPYRMKRLTAFTDPWADQFDSGYQLTQSLIAFGRGGWTGAGLGNSVQKLFYLPEAHTDFVFAIWAEEFGFLGAMFVLVLFALLIAKILRIARDAELRGLAFNGFVAYGIAIMLAAQVFINIGVNIGLLPTKGLTLPFMSYGGSSLMVCVIMMAMVARISQENGGRHAN